MTKRLTVLEKLADNVSTLDRVNVGSLGHSRSYREGKIAAYNDSYRIMKIELERLRNLWQNDALTYDSFGLPN